MTSSADAHVASHAPLSPRTYRPTWKTRLGLNVFALFSAVVGVALFVGGARASSSAGMALAAVLGSVCMLGGVYIALDAAIARIVWTTDDIWLHELHGVLHIGRADVSHYRLLRTAHGSMLVDARKSFHGIIAIPEVVALDRAFAARFGGLRDLKLHRLTGRESFVEHAFHRKDGSEALAQLARASKLGTFMVCLGVAAVFCAFIPTPFALAVAPALAVPPLVLLALKRSNGKLSHHVGHPAPLDLGSALLLPCMAVGCRVFISIDVQDWLPALCAGLGVGIALALLTLMADPSSCRAALFPPLFCLFYTCYGYGAVVSANVLLDSSRPRLVEVKVVGKHQVNSTRRHRSCSLDLETQASVAARTVRCKLYDQVSTGERLDIATWSGALGIRWSRLQKAQASAATSPGS
jgi:hypothetical protein